MGKEKSQDHQLALARQIFERKVTQGTERDKANAILATINDAINQCVIEALTPAEELARILKQAAGVRGHSMIIHTLYFDIDKNLDDLNRKITALRETVTCAEEAERADEEEYREEVGNE